MATLVLGVAGAAIGGSIGGTILGVSAATIGGFIGSTVGSVVDSWIISSLAPTQRIEGPRLDSLRITSSTEGAVVSRLYGRMRIGGNIIWATDFREETRLLRGQRGTEQAMNKEAAGDDLGLTLQTGYVTKALVGLFGSDKFRLAVSADGSTFFDGLIVDNANGIVDQPRLPRFKGYTNYDNYVAVDSWTKIGINNTDYNDQGAFDAANNRFVAPVAGTYLFGAALLYKVNSSTTARMRGRLVLNGTTEIRGSRGEISGAHASEATALWLQTMTPFAQGDTVELQGTFRAADGYFAADHTSFWGCKVG